jgi:hypothetical protein
MDNPLTPDKQNTALEDALHTYPILSMPRDITADVMARIHTIPAPRPFRITWDDFVIALVLSLCIGAVWFGTKNFPPLVIAQIRMQTILFHQDLIVNARWLIPVVSFGLAAFLSALTIPYLRQELTK